MKISDIVFSLWFILLFSGGSLLFMSYLHSDQGKQIKELQKQVKQLNAKIK